MLPKPARALPFWESGIINQTDGAHRTWRSARQRDATLPDGAGAGQPACRSARFHFWRAFQQLGEPLHTNLDRFECSVRARNTSAGPPQRRKAREGISGPRSRENRWTCRVILVKEEEPRRLPGTGEAIALQRAAKGRWGEGF